MPTKKMSLQRLFVPITRQEQDANGDLIVEGYCYVNAEVGDGVNLTRQAMEDAAPDYMKFAALREMHQPKAAGSGLSVDFDDKGAFFRAIVVDADAKEKVEKGVYKGFSVGVKPEVMRGSDVLKCRWPEVSLVDRPADWDATLAISRAEGFDEAAEFEVEVDDAEATAVEPPEPEGESVAESEEPEEARADVPDITRGKSFTDAMKSREKGTLCDVAISELSWRLYSIQQDEDSDDKETLVRSLCKEFANYIAPLVARGEIPVYTRTEQNSALIQRVETAETETAEVKRLLAASEERVKVLEAEPVSITPVVRYPKAFDATQFRNARPLAQASEVDAIRQEYDDLVARLQDEPDPVKRSDGAAKMGALKTRLRQEFGETL